MKPNNVASRMLLGQEPPRAKPAEAKPEYEDDEMEYPVSTNQDAHAFFAFLMAASTAVEQHHLKSKSYARHMALGSLYESINGAVDGLVEAYQGIHGLIETYPPMPPLAVEECVPLVESIYQYVETNRMKVARESFIQNDIDTLVSSLSSALYKLKYLD